MCTALLLVALPVLSSSQWGLALTRLCAGAQQSIFQLLLQDGGTVDWQERYITSRFNAAKGRVKQPRLIAYQADDASLAYTYSSDTLAPQPWSEPVLRVKVRVWRLRGFCMRIP